MLKNNGETNIDTRNLLIKNLEELKYLYNCPNLYLYDYFTELRRRIDLAVAEKLVENEHLSISDDYIEMINRINTIEKDCNECILTNEFVYSYSKANSLHIIQLIEDEINNNNNQLKFDLNNLIDCVYEQAFNLKSILFNNQTIEFIEINGNLVDGLFRANKLETEFGKLLIVKNQFFDKRGLSFINK
jgi:hypothetical protein